ncbi:MAG: ATPase [Paludibacteraceae bacterium]|nr:ATPase [Prevotella sp.]MBQ8705758.1 ATPase [Paludibacteraceae bacterium]MBQ8715586.1 ATPase [Prevotella sp.]
MKLIADSGSTKTDWTLLYDSGLRTDNVFVATFKTQGITPIHQSPAEIRQILAQELMPQLSTFSRAQLVNSKILESPLLSNIQVFFYGSGCTPAHVPMMKQMLDEVFSPKTVEVYSDLMAAARALCGHEEGIACILGTGANSCLYDGEKIIQNTPALGYILGDEGSGAVLGRLFLNAIFKDPRFEDIRDAYLAETKLTVPIIINKVYREPLANRFLASTSSFIQQHLDFEPLRAMVIGNFRTFFQHNLVQYQRRDLPVHAVGSIAYYYQEELKEAAQQEGFTLGTILSAPMEGLINYHQ